jgi:hypothetical protein
MSRVRRQRAAPNVSAEAMIRLAFAGLPASVRKRLNRHAALLPAFAEVQCLSIGGILPQHVTQLARRWRDQLPQARGRVVKLGDYMQGELFERPRRPRRPKRRKKPRIGAQRVRLKWF